MTTRSPSTFLEEACRIKLPVAELCAGWGQEGKCIPDRPCRAHSKIAAALFVAYEEGLRAAGPRPPSKDGVRREESGV